MALVTTFSSPEETERRKVQFTNIATQGDHEINLMKRLPEMKAQRIALKKVVVQARAVLHAIEAGFDPFTTPDSWYAGFLTQPAKRKRDLEHWLQYSRAFPLPVLEKYLAAKHSGLFNLFSIHAASVDVFRNMVEPSLYNSDPLLAGWIEGKVSKRGQPSGTQAFLIATFDIATDLAATGLLLTEGEEEQSQDV